MIRSVTVTNHKGESLDLDFFDPWRSGIAVASIDGLGPPQATINMTELSTVDGSVFNSARMQSRILDLRLILVEKPTIEDSRHIVYKYFPIKKPITFRIVTDKLDVYTVGYVETVIPNVFSDFEDVTISIQCPDPFLYSSNENEVLLNGIEGGFEFPFSNPVNMKTLKFGELTSNHSTGIYYEGTDSVGIEISMIFSYPTQPIAIKNLTSKQEMLINTNRIEELIGSSIQADDRLIISTITGKKSVKFYRNDLEFNVLACLGWNPQWIQLYPGDNVFSFYIDGGENTVKIFINYKESYEGI